MWFENKGELIAFLRALNEANTLEFDDILRFLEKPWKWDDEYDAWIRAGRPAEVPDIHERVAV